MLTISFLTTVAGSVLVIYQDWSRRWIHVGSLLLILIGSLTYIAPRFAQSVPSLFANIVFLGLLFMVLRIYIRVKYGSKERFLNRHIGVGDLLMLLSITASYPLSSFIIVILCSCAVCIASWMVKVLFFGRSMVRIPLAAAIAGTHLLIYLFNPGDLLI